MTPEKREAAIAWLNDEIRSLRMAPEINGFGPEKWVDQLQIMETCLEAVRSTDRSTDRSTEPLTLEQLREMDGKPVWVEDLKNHGRSAWRLIYWDRGKYLILIAKSSDGYILEEYGKTWLAYAYPPAHINREAWEPCDECTPSCWNCIDFDSDEDTCPINCQRCVNHNNYRTRFKFCSECGRPLTPEAWAMLEKRLRGQPQTGVYDTPVCNPKSSEKDQVRISSSKGPDGLQIHIGFKCGSVAKDISFVFDKQDPPLDEIFKFFSQQLTELVQSLNGNGRAKK